MATNASPTESTSVDYRALLEHERSDLLRQLAEMGMGENGNLQYDANFADTSQVTAERGEVEALATELKETLDEVEAAIARLDDGTYGICEICGKPIGPARLEAMPTATRCINDANRR